MVMGSEPSPGLASSSVDMVKESKLLMDVTGEVYLLWDGSLQSYSP
jgi:hypothetical protein